MKLNLSLTCHDGSIESVEFTAEQLAFVVTIVEAVLAEREDCSANFKKAPAPLPEPATLGATGAEPDISLSDVRRVISQAQAVNRDDTINTITRIRRDFGVDVLDQMSGTQRWMLVQELTKIVDAVSVENITS